MMASIYRKKREEGLADTLIRKIAGLFHRDWEGFIRVEVNNELNGYIHRVVKAYPLRGSDAIHLASAMVIHERIPKDFVFACFDDRLVCAASPYIHTNPARAGIVKNPLRYRWSSIKLYCDNDAPESFVDPRFILGLLPGNDSRRNEEYRRLLKRGSELEADLVLEQEKAVYHFKEKLVSIFPSIFQQADGKGKAVKAFGFHLISPNELERRTEEIIPKLIWVIGDP